MRIPFDTHAFVKKLTAAGVSEAQAEVHAEAFGELVIERLATREDIARLEEEIARVREEVTRVREDLRAYATKEDIARLEEEIARVREGLRAYATKADLKDLELRVTLRVGAMLAAAVAIIVALVKLL